MQYVQYNDWDKNHQNTYNEMYMEYQKSIGKNPNPSGFSECAMKSYNIEKDNVLSCVEETQLLRELPSL